MARAHVNHRALSALLARADGLESHLAMRAGISAGHLHDLKSGRNLGTNSHVRAAVAEVLGEPVEAITCWCSGQCREGVAA